jgi:hypothetical protein
MGLIAITFVNQCQAIDSEKQLDNRAQWYESSAMKDISLAIAALGMLLAIAVSSFSASFFKAAVDAPFKAQAEARAD